METMRISGTNPGGCFGLTSQGNNKFVQPVDMLLFSPKDCGNRLITKYSCFTKIFFIFNEYENIDVEIHRERS